MTVGALKTPVMLAFEALAASAAVALFVAAASRAQGPAPGLAAVTAALLFGVALIRVLQRLDIDDVATRRIGLPVLLLGACVIAFVEHGLATGAWSWQPLVDALRHPRATLDDHTHIVSGVAALCAVSVRGVVVGRAPLDFEDVLTNASVGLIVVALAAGIDPAARWPDAFALVAFAYAVIVLFALIVYRAPEPEAPVTSWAGRWAGVLSALVAGSLLVAVVAAAIDPDAFGFLAPVGEAATAVAGPIVYVIVAPFFWLLTLLIRGVAWIIAWLLPVAAPTLEPDVCAPLPNGELPEGCGPSDEGAFDSEPSIWSRVLGTIIATTLGGAVVIVALLVAYQAFRRFARRSEGAAGERRHDIEPASGLGDDLALLLDALRRPFRRYGSRPRPATGAYRLYFEMLDRAERDGLTRSPATTPSQFAPSLDGHFHSDLPEDITRAFEEARYGEREPDAARLRALRQQWRGIAGGG
jgi:hypothetical protein